MNPYSSIFNIMFSKCGCRWLVSWPQQIVAVQQNILTLKHFYYQKGKNKLNQLTNHSYADKGFLMFDGNYYIYYYQKINWKIMWTIRCGCAIINKRVIPGLKLSTPWPWESLGFSSIPKSVQLFGAEWAVGWDCCPRLCHIVFARRIYRRCMWWQIYSGRSKVLLFKYLWTSQHSFTHHSLDALNSRNKSIQQRLSHLLQRSYKLPFLEGK